MTVASWDVDIPLDWTPFDAPDHRQRPLHPLRPPRSTPPSRPIIHLGRGNDLHSTQPHPTNQVPPPLSAPVPLPPPQILLETKLARDSPSCPDGINLDAADQAMCTALLLVHIHQALSGIPSWFRLLTNRGEFCLVPHLNQQSLDVLTGTTVEPR